MDIKMFKHQHNIKANEEFWVDGIFLCRVNDNNQIESKSNDKWLVVVNYDINLIQDITKANELKEVEFDFEGLPQCPYCKTVPTYNINPCPYCSKPINYKNVKSEYEIIF